MVGRVTLIQPARGKDPPKNDPTTIKTQLHPKSQHKWHKGHHKSISTGDQGDCTTESHRFPVAEVHNTHSVTQNIST